MTDTVHKNGYDWTNPYTVASRNHACLYLSAYPSLLPVQNKITLFGS